MNGFLILISLCVFGDNVWFAGITLATAIECFYFYTSACNYLTGMPNVQESPNRKFKLINPAVSSATKHVKLT